MKARQINLHRRAGADLGINLDMPARLFDEAVDLAQTKPGALAGRFGGEERIEDSRRDVRGMPVPVSPPPNLSPNVSDGRDQAAAV